MSTEREGCATTKNNVEFEFHTTKGMKKRYNPTFIVILMHYI